jgi:hypothetical protein
MQTSTARRIAFPAMPAHGQPDAWVAALWPESGTTIDIYAVYPSRDLRKA